MARYAKGKKSYAISDRGGQRVRYTQLKTTWDGLRVAPDEWEPKHPQLTPARNVIDAQQLFKPRPDNDPEDVTIYIAHTFDPFTPSFLRKVGAAGVGSQGEINIDELERYPEATGVSGTGAVGTETPQIESNPSASGLGGTGAVGTEALELTITEAGVAGTGAVGTETLELSIDEAGVAGTGATGTELGFLEVTGNGGNAGTGAVGVEALNLSISEAGVAGTGAVGTATVDIPAWGFGTWGSGTWGN